jgi:2-iminobutanoate/2-iminopropanoate deaminase
MKSVVATEKAPQAIGPYSQAVRIKCGELLFVSGQIPLDPSSGEVVQGGIESQTRQVLKNLEEVLKAGGSSLESVLKTTVYLRNLDDFPKMNEVYQQFFRKAPPARSTVEVSRLPRQAEVEIDAIAVVESGGEMLF